MPEPLAETERPDCRCSSPKPTGRGTCGECGRFACEYADQGRTRCSPTICDCFIEAHPDSPRDLHPEDFAVRTPDGWFVPEPINRPGEADGG